MGRGTEEPVALLRQAGGDIERVCMRKQVQRAIYIRWSCLIFLSKNIFVFGINVWGRDGEKLSVRIHTYQPLNKENKIEQTLTPSPY